jgi:hypothetical protein
MTPTTEEATMRPITVLCAALALAPATAIASAGGAPELLKSATRFAPLQPHVMYQASLFSPELQITAPDGNWQGAQFVSHGYAWVILPQRPPNRGGVAMISAPRSTQSAATTLHRLQTERADVPAVGITTRPAHAVTIGGFRGQQFDGTVTGRYGHTFVPFSSSSGGASSSAGDHLRLGNGKAFRIVVLNVRGKPVVFEIDADSATLDSSFLTQVTNLLALLRFPKG